MKLNKIKSSIKEYHFFPKVGWAYGFFESSYFSTYFTNSSNLIGFASDYKDKKFYILD